MNHTVMMEQYNRVKRWMESAGQLTQHDDCLSEKVFNLRISLLEEEVEELKEAIKAKDEVAIADALADIMVVVYGTFACYRDGYYPISGIKPGVSTNRVLLPFRMFKQTKRRIYLYEIIRDCYSLAHKYDIQLESCVYEVIRSNDTKLLPCSSCNGTGKTVLFRADGKILKPDTFEEPKLERFIRRLSEEFLD